MPDGPAPHPAPARRLSVWDCTSIIVGIIIGAGIYQSSPIIAQSVWGPWMLVGVWLLGGLVALIGALCYAELATMFPHAGGDYVYLTRAYGRRVGFLFAWTELWVIRPGGVGAMAFIFAQHARELWPLQLGGDALGVYAVSSVAVLTGLNLLGVSGGVWTQNLLTAVKVVGMAALFIAGLLAPGANDASATTPPTDAPSPDFALAMILVLFTYGGWNDISYVAAEVRNPHRNILRSLVLGLAAVTGLYLLATWAFVHALGFEGLQNSDAPASVMLAATMGGGGATLINTLICISCLGAINGMLFTGSRIYFALGADHRLYAWLGRWSARFNTPARSLLLQAAVTIGLLLTFASNHDGFKRLVIFTAPPFWLFFFMTGVSLFIFRKKTPEVARPYRVALYPITPLLFCASCLFMLYSSFDYAWEHRHPEAIWTLAALAAGVVVSFFDPAKES